MNVLDPERSLVLLKATGQVPHKGGAVVRAWVKTETAEQLLAEAGVDPAKEPPVAEPRANPAPPPPAPPSPTPFDQR